MSRTAPRTTAFILCTLLCIVFALVSWMAIRGKSATWDEPSHALTGWLMLYQHDYRLSPDVPPLWEYWIALPLGRDAILFDPNSPLYNNFRVKHDLFLWCVRTLYHTPGNDGIALVNHARMMSLVLALVLAIMIGRWSWRLAGPAAAVAAMFLYCLDPNFLAHGPLVKNDIAFALLYFAAAYAVWRAGQRLTLFSISSIALLTAAALAVKLSGVLLGPVVVIALLARACASEPWMILGRLVERRRSKIAAVLAVCGLTIVVTYAGLWASYGFRFDAGPNGLRMDTAYYVETLKRIQVFLRADGHPQPGDLEKWKMPLSTGVIVFMEKHHLLPQAWTSGFVLTQTGDLNRSAFLCGFIYNGGKWYYFPRAMLFKTPLATILAAIIALVMGRIALHKGLLKSWENRWTAIALGVPALIYAAAILTANLNIGLRHALPLYPFAFVAVSLAGAKAWAMRPRAAGQASMGQIVVLILATGLAAETAAAFPNYVPFFNTVFASHRLSLLSDSNLDWGQDLPLLASWQRQHPDVPLYLEYFGLCDPAAYGIRYINVPGGYLYGPPQFWPSRRGVVAISATCLQQVYSPNRDLDLATLFRDRKPMAVLGDSIYLFDFNPQEWLKTAAAD